MTVTVVYIRVAVFLTFVCRLNPGLTGFDSFSEVIGLKQVLSEIRLIELLYYLSVI
jgi:hypothetical protein